MAAVVLGEWASTCPPQAKELNKYSTIYYCTVQYTVQNSAHAVRVVYVCVFFLPYPQSYLVYIYADVGNSQFFGGWDWDVGLPILTIKCSLCCGWVVSTVNFLWMGLSCTGRILRWNSLRAFLFEFLGMNSSLLLLESLSGFLALFFLSTKCCSRIDWSFLVSRIFMYVFLKPEYSLVFFKNPPVARLWMAWN
jgi:hypothetical protein